MIKSAKQEYTREVKYVHLINGQATVIGTWVRDNSYKSYVGATIHPRPSPNASLSSRY